MKKERGKQVDRQRDGTIEKLKESLQYNTKKQIFDIRRQHLERKKNALAKDFPTKVVWYFMTFLQFHC